MSKLPTIEYAEGPTLEDWLTKQQAAQFLGVAEKTLDRMAAAGEVQKATRKRPGKPPVVVFHPDDIGRARAVRQESPAPFVMPSTAVQPVSRVEVQPVSDFHVQHEHVGQVGQVTVTSPGQAGHVADVLPPSELRQLLLVSREQAKQLGFTGAILAAAVRAGKLERLPGDRYRVRDLESI